MKAVYWLLAGALLSAPIAFADPGAPSRQEQVAAKGAGVMPFDLTRTTHFFDDNATGGVETITANTQDAQQIDLIRSHLAAEAKRFGHGDFSDPAKIHGADMPGLAGLSSAGGRLRVTYSDVPGGASLTYASEDKAIIAAIHDWFGAQRFDHAAHAHLHHMDHDMPMHHDMPPHQDTDVQQ